MYRSLRWPTHMLEHGPPRDLFCRYLGEHPRTIVTPRGVIYWKKHLFSCEQSSQDLGSPRDSYPTAQNWEDPCSSPCSSREMYSLAPLPFPSEEVDPTSLTYIYSSWGILYHMCFAGGSLWYPGPFACSSLLLKV